MSTQIDYARIVLLNRTKRELAAADPVLLSGEASIADVGSIHPDLRFGDGIRPWSALPSFLATGIGGGIFAPFEVQNTINGHALFRVNDQIVPPGGSVITMGPGEVGGTGYSILSIGGNPNGTVVKVWASHNTLPGAWITDLHGTGWDSEPDANDIYGRPPPGYLGPVPGTSNGLRVSAGTNANDTAFLVRDDGFGGLRPYINFFRIRGDGSGFLGPDENNCVYWDTTGWFKTRGTARFPGDAISELRDVQIAGLRLGDTLEWNGTYWANVPPQRGTVTQINTGTGLIGGPIFESGTIALANTTVTPGYYTNATITIDAQGRITTAENGSMADLEGVHIADAADGQVLTYDGGRWTNKPPPELATLPDVELSEPIDAGQHLTWDGEKWTNSDPAHTIGELANVLITDPRPGELLTFDGTNWVNKVGSAVSVDAVPPFDPWSGKLWWDNNSGQLFIWYVDEESGTGEWIIANNTEGAAGPGGGASVTVATSPPADPQPGWLWWDAVGGQLYVWYDDGVTAQWVIANSADGAGGGGGGSGGFGASVSVAATPPANPQSGWLWWSSTSGQLFIRFGNQWVMANTSVGGGDGGGASSLAELPDVDFSAHGDPPVIADASVLTYNATAQKWGAASLPAGSTTLAGLTDTLISSPVTGQPLTWNGTAWVNTDILTLRSQFYVRTADNANLRFSVTPNVTTGQLLYASAPPNVTTLAIQPGINTLPTFVEEITLGASVNASGLRVTSTASVANTLLQARSSNTIDRFLVRGDGSGMIGGMSWDTSGVTTLTDNAARMIGLPVPLAFSFRETQEAFALTIAITMPLTIPANLAGSRAGCEGLPNFPVTHRIYKGTGAAGSWVEIGAVAFSTASYVGVFSGTGGTLAAGDLLQVVTEADEWQSNVGITVHATRA